MASLNTLEEINKLKSRILELEQKEQDSNNKKLSIQHNFSVINDLLNERKNAITRNTYSKSIPLARYNDIQLVTYLEAIYNILQIIDTRLKILEN